MTHEKHFPILLAAAIAAATLSLGALTTSAEAALKHLDGTIVSKNAAAKTFRISTQNGNRVGIRVGASTRFERIAGGFGGIHAGLRVEVDARSTSSGLLATQVEPRASAGGEDGGHGGSDDGPNHI
jgi:hypothetical protein